MGYENYTDEIEDYDEEMLNDELDDVDIDDILDDMEDDYGKY